MLSGFLIPFASIILAEFLDKSQLSLIFLSVKTKHHLQMLLGSFLAFCIVDGVAILLGSFITTVIPGNVIKIVAALGFFLFGIKTLREKDEEHKAGTSHKQAFVMGFTAIFLSEWGDKTQIAAALFATKYPPFLVLAGTLAALFLLSVMAIYAGKFLLKSVNKRLLHLFSGVAFLLLGIVFLFS